MAESVHSSMQRPDDHLVGVPSNPMSMGLGAMAAGATGRRACGLPGRAGRIPARHGADWMNKDQIKGAAKEVTGKVQKEVGKRKEDVKDSAGKR